MIILIEGWQRVVEEYWDAWGLSVASKIFQYILDLSADICLYCQLYLIRTQLHLAWGKRRPKNPSSYSSIFGRRDKVSSSSIKRCEGKDFKGQRGKFLKC